MFRLLSSKKAAPSKAKSRSKKAEVIDVEEEDKNKSLMIGESDQCIAQIFGKESCFAM